MPTCPERQLAQPFHAESTIPILFVDLDGTLIRGDLLHEALLRSVRLGPRSLFEMFLRATLGRAALKRWLAERVDLDLSRLPLRQEVLDLIVQARRKGVRIVLASATDSLWARDLCARLSVFDEVLASDGRRNLKGDQKDAAITAYCQVHGFSEFGYIGNSFADLAIWRHASVAYVVAPSRQLLAAVRRLPAPRIIIGSRPAWWVPLLAMMRPSRWALNGLVFVPALFLRPAPLADQWWSLTASLVAFSFCASAAYVVSDLADVEVHRADQRRSQRPFAALSIPLAWGPPIALLLAVFGFSVSTFYLPTSFLLLLICFVLAETVYSRCTSRSAFVVAGTVTCGLRVLGGVVALGT